MGALVGDKVAFGVLWGDKEGRTVSASIGDCVGALIGELVGVCVGAVVGDLVGPSCARQEL